MKKLALLLSISALLQAGEKPTPPRRQVSYTRNLNLMPTSSLSVVAEEEETFDGEELNDDAELLALATSADQEGFDVSVHELSLSCPPRIDSPETLPLSEQDKLFKKEAELHQAAKSLIITGQELLFRDKFNMPLRNIHSISEYFHFLHEHYTVPVQQKAIQLTLYGFKSKKREIIDLLSERINRMIQNDRDLDQIDQIREFTQVTAHSRDLETFLGFLKIKNYQSLLAQLPQHHYLVRSESTPALPTGKEKSKPKQTLRFSPDSKTALYCLHEAELTAGIKGSDGSTIKHPESIARVRQILEKNQIRTDNTPHLEGLAIVPTKTKQDVASTSEESLV